MNWVVWVGLAIGWLLVRAVRALPPGNSDTTGAEPIAVVIPARDEEASLGHLLDDLELVATTSTRVIVVDDDSTDRTAEIADRHDVHLVRSPGPPPGWAGKPHACHLGAGEAARLDGGDGLLVFLDADVRVDPDSLDRLTATQARLGGIVSVQPSHEPGSWREQLSAIFNLVSVMAVGMRSARPTGMFGPVICCSVADYRAVGGHRSVRGAVTEDLALARRFVDAGVPVHLFTGSFRFRMYPTGWRPLVEGWTKNIALGAAATPWWRTLAVGWWIAALISASIDVAVAPFGTGNDLAWALLTYLAAAILLAAMLRRVGRFRLAAVATFPVLVGGFLVIFVRSLWCTWVRRSVTWRSRTIPLRTGRRGTEQPA
jgi:4,4'-diaponeurosporenoate glycosyltransferase